MINPYANKQFKITSLYGYRTLYGNREFHKGIDLVGLDGKTILAISDGKIGKSCRVTDTSNRTAEWGNYVRLDTTEGKCIYYCHLSQRLIQEGQTVKIGDFIGIEGGTGKTNTSYGSHLHLEIRNRQGDSINAADYIGIANQMGICFDSVSSNPFHMGDTVQILSGALYTNGKKVPVKYCNKPYTIQKASGNKVLIKELFSWVEVQFIEAWKETYSW